MELKFGSVAFWFLWRDGNGGTQGKTLRARREPTANSTHMIVGRESNPGHLAGR